MLLSIPTRTGIPQRQVRRWAYPLGRPSLRGSDRLRRWIRSPLSPRYSPGGGHFPTQPPPIPPAPWPLRTGAGGRCPAHPPLVVGSAPADDVRRPASPVPGRLRPFDPDGSPRLCHGPLPGQPGPAPGEVAAMCLEDLDWRGGILRIASGKGGRARELPLSEGIGCAIADYLRQGRPLTACRRVFVRHTLPVGTAISRGPIAAAMCRASARVEGCCSGPVLMCCGTPRPPACTATGPASRRWPTSSATSPSIPPRFIPRLTCRLSPQSHCPGRRSSHERIPINRLVAHFHWAVLRHHRGMPFMRHRSSAA